MQELAFTYSTHHVVRAVSLGDQCGEWCLIFLMGPTIAPAGELATAINEARRRATQTKLLLVPINTRSWNAHVPTDAPPVVKSLLKRLKSA